MERANSLRFARHNLFFLNLWINSPKLIQQSNNPPKKQAIIYVEIGIFLILRFCLHLKSQ